MWGLNEPTVDGTIFVFRIESNIWLNLARWVIVRTEFECFSKIHAAEVVLFCWSNEEIIIYISCDWFQLLLAWRVIWFSFSACKWSMLFALRTELNPLCPPQFLVVVAIISVNHSICPVSCTWCGNVCMGSAYLLPTFWHNSRVEVGWDLVCEEIIGVENDGQFGSQTFVEFCSSSWVLTFHNDWLSW